MTKAPRLFHFTCQHSAARIGKRGLLHPNPHPLLDVALVWLTDLGTPDALGLGLTSRILNCDRIAFRYVTTQRAEPWREFVKTRSFDSEIIRSLEADATPEHWFVSLAPVKARLG